MTTIKKMAQAYKDSKEKKESLLDFYNAHKDEYKIIAKIMADFDKTLDNLTIDSLELDNHYQLYVAEYLDYDIDENNEIEYKKDWDVAVFVESEQNRYSTLTFEFKELINMPIYELSLEKYGEHRVFMECLWEITWFGPDSEISKVNQDDFLRRLNEEVDDDDFIDDDDLFDEIGFAEPSTEYKKAMTEALNVCGEYNRKVSDEFGFVG